MTNAAPDATQAKVARIAGALYLVTMATASLVELFVRGSLIVSGDAARTAQNLIESERLFRVGIAGDLATFTGVLVLVWALYVLLRPVDRNLAVLALSLRLIEVAIHCVITLNGLVALRFLSSAAHLKAFDAGQLHSLARVALGAQATGLNVGFIFLGLGSTVFAYLLLRSRYVPRLLAGWGMASALLLAIYSFSIIVFPGLGEQLQIIPMLPMGIYEITLGFWLLIRGARLAPRSEGEA